MSTNDKQLKPFEDCGFERPKGELSSNDRSNLESRADRLVKDWDDDKRLWRKTYERIALIWRMATAILWTGLGGGVLLTLVSIGLSMFHHDVGPVEYTLMVIALTVFSVGFVLKVVVMVWAPNERDRVLRRVKFKTELGEYQRKSRSFDSVPAMPDFYYTEYMGYDRLPWLDKTSIALLNRNFYATVSDSDFEDKARFSACALRGLLLLAELTSSLSQVKKDSDRKGFQSRLNKICLWTFEDVKRNWNDKRFDKPARKMQNEWSMNEIIADGGSFVLQDFLSMTPSVSE